MPKNNFKNNNNLIRLVDIVKSYKTQAGDFLALKNINLAIDRQEFIAVIGKSGSGKSTLINMIAGIDRPTKGEIYFEGQPIHKLSESEMAVWRGKNLGVVFQFFQLLSNLTVLENIMLPMDFGNVYLPYQREEKALQLLDLVNLRQHAYKMPPQLSGGQQQRVAIARALANDPPVIIADEPTGNLDSRTAEHIFEIFSRLVERGKTILMVTHDNDLAKKVKRTLIISDGEIIEEYLARTFPSLTENQLIWITSKIKQENYPAGEVIVRKGALIDKLYIVIEGEVEIVLTPKRAQSCVVARFKRGQYFGEIELVRGGKSIATARASLKNPVKLATLSHRDFKQLLEKSVRTKKEIEKTVISRLKEHQSASGRNINVC